MLCQVRGLRKNHTRNLGNILLLRFLYLSYKIWDNSTKSISLKSRFSNYSQSYRRFFVITYYESGGFPLISKWKFWPFFPFWILFFFPKWKFWPFFLFWTLFFFPKWKFRLFFPFWTLFFFPNWKFWPFFPFCLIKKSGKLRADSIKMILSHSFFPDFLFFLYTTI